MKRFLSIPHYVCLFAIVVFVFNGCATLFHGSTDKIDFSAKQKPTAYGSGYGQLALPGKGSKFRT